MTTTSFDALSEKLSAHIELSKSRMETLVLLITGMIGARTVNLSHVASERGSNVLPASTYRRLQRFFQYVKAEEDWAVRLIISLLGLSGQRTLCLDRTNWKLGKTDINVLVLAVVTDRHRVPLMWTFLDGAGSSSTAERIGLIRRYIELFGAPSIKRLLGDREFIGVEWMNFLNENNVPFVIRVKKGMCVILEDGRRFTLSSLLRRTKRPSAYEGHLSYQTNRDCSGSPSPPKRSRRVNGSSLPQTRTAITRSKPTASAGSSSVCSAIPKPAV